MFLYICEYEFVIPDRENPNYSLAELDFYGSKGDHRLSLRKNLITGNYELYKHFHRDDRDLVVLETKDLQEALNKVNELWNITYPGLEKREADQVCTHEYPRKANGCDIWRRKAEELKQEGYKTI